jgi:hypothetical protein
VVFPGQVQLPPQPQYAPTPAQQQPQSFASGFPNYRSPAPSPKNRTGLIVGIIVCLVVIAGAVIGFWLVGCVPDRPGPGAPPRARDLCGPHPPVRDLRRRPPRSL